MKSILIADDKPENQYLLRVLLEGNGYQVTLAAHGGEALEKARQHPPDLIIADILMPVMDGFALCREWKKDEQLRRIPFIFYTATYTDERDRDFALGLGAEKFIIKPEEPDFLLELIQETIQQIKKSPAVRDEEPKPARAGLPIEFPEAEETGYLKQYNQTLVRKLESKMEMLEKANRLLERDIAERQRAEETLRLQTSALNAADNAIFITDHVGIIQWINPAWSKVTGYSAGEAVGKTPRLLKSGVQNDSFYQNLWDVVLAGKVWKGEMVNRRKDGNLYTEQVTITPVTDDKNRVTHFIGIMDDITERKKIERQLLLSQRMESIGRLATGIAHDLNNILTPMMMSTYILRDTSSPTDIEEVISLIETNTRRATAIIKQLLTFGRGVSGERVAIDLEHLISEMVKIAQETFPRNITSQSHVCADLLPLAGDATQLHQVLLNLCINARDAMPNGGVLTIRAENSLFDEVALSTNPDVKPGPCVRIEVADTGEGIPPENLDKLFEPFFTTKEIGKGTGMGLATVLGIVKSHGGFVQARSRVGEGTAFEVFLPASPEQQQNFEIPVQPEIPRGRNELILVVDDEASIRQMTHQLLERNGYRTLVAADGAEAFVLFTKNRDSVRLILTDFMMPRMDGRALAKVVMNLDPHLPIIIASGLGEGLDQSKVAELQALGVKTLLSKPYTSSELLSAVKAALPS